MLLKKLVLTFAVATVGLASAVQADQAQSQARSRAEVEAEREQARFRAMDVNDDGIITRREWRGNASAFDRFDTNRDGKLAGSEIWIPANPKSQVAKERGFGEQDQFNEELMQPFYDADRNNDRRLSRTEWWSDAATFSRVDRNRDGFLTRDEYLDTDEIFDIPVGTAGNDAQKQTRAYQAAYQRGMVDGRQAGKEDKQGPNKWDLEGQSELEQADSGYVPDLGRREDYQAGYRSGFRLGYRQGFGPRR